MQLLIDGLSESTHWRIYCRAVEHGRSVNDEILATLNARNTEIAPDAESRLEAARNIRQQVRSREGPR